MRDRYLRIVSGNFFSQLVTLVAGIAGTAVTARELGPEGRGIVATVTLYPQLGWSILSLGFNTAIIRFLASERLTLPQARDNALSSALVSGALGIAVSLVAWNLEWNQVPKSLRPAFQFSAALGLFLLGTADLFAAALLQAQKRIPVINRSQIIGIAVLLVSLILFVKLLGWGVPGALLSYILSAIARLASNSAGLVNSSDRYGFRPRFHALRQMTDYALKGHSGNLIQLINYRFDMVVLTQTASDAQIGIYSVATKLAELLWLLPKSIAFVHFADAASSERATNSIRQRVLVTAILVVISGIALALLAKPIILLVFGREYLSAYLPVLYLIPGTMALGCTKILTSDIAGRGFPGCNSISAAIGAAITLTATLPLYNRLGISGAAIASSLSYVAIAGVSVAFHLYLKRASRYGKR